MNAQPHPAAFTILHLSDIHRTRDEPVDNDSILHALTADLQRQQADERLPKPDILVVSGDLTQRADPNGYQEAYALLDRLKDELTVPSLSRVILAPGNHDIHWALSKAHCEDVSAKPAGVDLALQFGRPPNCHFWPNEEAYARRLEAFSALYQLVYGRPYASARRDQFDIWVYTDLGVCFVGLNSCDLVDHHRRRGAILDQALFAVQERLRQQIAGDPRDYLKIAIWHHDLNWMGSKARHRDSLDPAILGHLVDAGFDLALVGHAHRTDFNRYQYHGYSLPIVAAGSLCAGPRQRDESIPRLYNLIEIRGNHARVHTRSRETKDTPWHPYAQWGTQSLPYFDVPLRPDTRSAALLFNRSAQTISEWKALHHHLHDVRTSLVPLVALLDSDLDSEQRWHPAPARHLLSTCSTKIDTLCEFAKTIRHIGIPLQRQADDDLVGEPWIVQPIRLRERAAAELREGNLAYLCEVVLELSQLVDLYLNVADEELKERIDRLCAAGYWPADEGSQL